MPHCIFPNSICRVKVNLGRYNAASAFKVQMTNTPAVGTSWVDIASVTNNNPTVGNESGSNYYDWYVYNNLNITVTGNTGRYIRIWVGSLSNPNWFISEVEVYEQAASNSVPGCSFTAPTGNISIAAGTAYTLKVNASDPDPGGSIAEVGFYSGSSSTTITNLLNDPPQTQSPFEYTWTPTTPGIYFIQAKAKDNVGAIGSSGVIQVTVTAPNIGWGLLGNEVAQPNTSTTSAFLGTTDAQPFIVKTNDIERYRVTENGKMLIGSTSVPPGAAGNTLLTVNGFIMSKGLKVTQLAVNWPDYVFEKDYNLMPLPDLKSFIKKNKHLPGLPTATEVEKNGFSVEEIQSLLLKKVEELTLYMIDQSQLLEKTQKENAKLKAEILKIRALLKK